MRLDTRQMEKATGEHAPLRYDRKVLELENLQTLDALTSSGVEVPSKWAGRTVRVGFAQQGAPFTWKGTGFKVVRVLSTLGASSLLLLHRDGVLSGMLWIAPRGRKNG